jgi:hypothetical protein
MIKFFRKIRQNLLSEGKTGKYFKYAIGEIVLVVIGILIALQLNNLNDQKKINNQEKKLLAELVNNLDENLTLFENFNNEQNRRIHLADSILNHFKNNTATDSLSKIFSPLIWNDNLNLSFSTFETIKTIGFDLIKDDQIRRNIIELFEVTYPVRLNAITNTGSATQEIYYNWNFKNGHLRNRIFNSTLYRNDENYQSIGNFIEFRRRWKSAMIINCIGDMEETEVLKQLILDYLEESK